MYDGLAAVYDDVVGEPVHPTWAAFAHDAWSADPVPVERVLDVCCGTGLMSAELVARGYAVTGVDGSAPMIEAARTLLGPDVPLSVSVLPELAVEGVFDAAVCTFDSLNYLRPPEFALALRAIAGRLREGGWLVLDLHTEAMMRTIAAAPVSEARSGALHLAMSSDVDLEARTCVTQVVVTPDAGAPIHETHRQYFFGDDEIRTAADQAGLSVVSVTDDYTTAPVDPGALRSTWVLRRGE